MAPEEWILVHEYMCRATNALAQLGRVYGLQTWDSAEDPREIEERLTAELDEACAELAQYAKAICEKG